MQIAKNRKRRLTPPTAQLLKVMKLTTIFLFAMCLQVSANGYSQKVTLSLKNAPIEKLIREIRKQTGYFFLYKREQLINSPRVSIRLKETELPYALEQGLSGTPLTFKIVDQTIILMQRTTRENIERTQHTKTVINIQVSGRIISEATGEPLSGASVKLKGSADGTATDADGNFSLLVPDGGGVLIISYVGYEPTEVQVRQSINLNIRLKQKENSVDEVVVVGYGAVKRSDLTGSVSSVSSEKVTQVKAVSNVAGALQGQAAGVQVMQRSGQPGEYVSIRIRGVNSIAGGNDPLYVVDGLPLDGLSAQLNPSDIDKIEVLKDASATAIYGSRGANGVILITTKKGKEGKAKVTYNGYYGTQSLRKKVDVINASEYAQLQNEVAANDGQPQKWTAGQIDSLRGKGVDWQDLVYRNAPVQNHDIAMSGGNLGTKYYSSLGYYDQDGIITNSNFKRLSFRGNLDQKITDRLNANISLSLQNSKYFAANYANADFGGIPFQTMVMPPTVGIYEPDGKYTTFTGVPWGQTNPYGMANDEWRPSTSFHIIGNAVINYEIANGLRLKVSAGVDNRWNRSDYHAPNTISFSQVFGASKNYSNSSSFINENLLAYKKDFGIHSIDAVGGITYQEGKSEHLNSGTAIGFLTDIYQNYNIQSAQTLARPSTGFSDYKLISYLARANYNYAGKYLLTLTGRYDGSSKFGENNKYAFFPSGAVGWRVSQEPFMENVTAVSNLKLRASYGLSGNQAIGPYQTQARLQNVNVVFNNLPNVGYVLSGLENRSLRWETTRQLDIGFDLGMLNDRIQLTADYYNKKTTELLLNVTLPPSSGFGTVLQNVGAVQNKGFEFQLSTVNLEGDFGWTSVLSFSHNKTKLVDLGRDALGNPITYKEVGPGGNWFPMIIGQSMQQLYGYKVLGIYQADEEAAQNGEPTKKAGDYKFQDTDANGVVDGNDRITLTNLEPKFTYGFNNSFSYKNFNLSVLIVGSYGNDIVNEFRKYNITLNGNWVPSKEAFDARWVGKGTSNLYDKPSAVSGSSIRDYANSLWVEDASYLRVRDITLAYNFTPRFMQAANLSSLQIYISAQNYFTISNYSGYDPEASWNITSVNGWDRGVYPSMKSVIGGVKLNF